MSDLRGIVLRADPDALVVQATPDEVRRFMADHHEDTARRVTVAPIQATGRVRFQRTTPEPIDVTSFGARHHRTYVQGLPDLVAVGAAVEGAPEPGRLRVSRPNTFLYDDEGRPVCVVTHVEAESRIDGMRSVTITARGLDGIQLE